MSQRQENNEAKPAEQAANVYPRGEILRKVLTALASRDADEAAKNFQLWRVCHKGACRRARACAGDALQCCGRFVDWAEQLVETDSNSNIDTRRLYRALMRLFGDGIE